MAQFASKEAIANTPRSPQFNNIISPSDDSVKRKSYNLSPDTDEGRFITRDMKIDSSKVTLKLDIKKSPQKNKFWVHSIYTIEKVSDFPASTNDGAEAGQYNR